MPSFPKPGWNQKKARAKKRRQDGKVAKTVREKCVLRDGHCRLGRGASPGYWGFGHCAGLSEFAHLVRRSQTRGMTAERRHQSSTSVMLCRRHHQDEEAHRLRISGNADGPLRFVSEAGDEYQE